MFNSLSKSIWRENNWLAHSTLNHSVLFCYYLISHLSSLGLQAAGKNIYNKVKCKQWLTTLQSNHRAGCSLTLRKTTTGWVDVILVDYVDINWGSTIQPMLSMPSIQHRQKNTTTSSDTDYGSRFGWGRWRPVAVAVETWNTLGRSATGHRAQARATPICLVFCLSKSLASCVHELPAMRRQKKKMTLPNTFETWDNLILSLILFQSVKFIK